MRIRRLHVSAFGRHRELTLEELDGPSPVVFLGANEAGKSTLFRLIRTLLYGFAPANRDQNPDVPWEGGHAALSATLVDRCGPLEVERRLRSRPDGRWRRGDHLEDLANRPLPVVADLSPRLYDALYALTLEDLRPLERPVLGNLHDRVFASSGHGVLRPVGEVLDRLQKERKDLARDDQRGKPRARRLQERIRRWKERREAVREEERRRRELQHERGEVEVRLADAERQARRLDRLRKWAPLHRAVQERESLIADVTRWVATPIPPDLPEDPAAALRELREHRERSRQELRRRQARLEEWNEALAILSPGASAHGRQLEEFRDAMQRAGVREESIRTEEARLAEGERELQASFRDTAGVDATQDDRLALAELDLDRVRQLVQRAEGLARRRESTPVPPATSRGTVAALMLALLASATVAVALPLSPWLRAGTSLALVGTAVVVAVRRRGRSAAADRTRRQIDRLDDEERDLRSAWSGILGVLASRFPVPGSSLVPSLEHWVRQERRQSELRRCLEGWRRENRSLLAEWSRFRERRFPSLVDAQEDLEAVWSALHRRVTRARLIREDLPEEKAALARDAEQVRRWEERLERLASTLHETTATSPGQEEDACRRLRSARDHQRRIARLEEMLAEHQDDAGEYAPEFQDVLRDPDFDSSAGAVAEAGAERRRLERSIEAAHRRLGEITAELERPGESLESLDSAISVARKELHQVLAQHDRLLAMECLLRAADRRFREGNESAVLTAASGSLSTLTQGRYDRLSVDEEQGLFVSGAAVSGRAHPADGDLSRGTREQIQLALRLAFLRRLDEDRGESLPVILDEALVNFDPVRLDRTLSLLQDLSQDTQFLMFTCQPWFAERARQQIGARVVPLQRDTDVRSTRAAGDTG